MFLLKFTKDSQGKGIYPTNEINSLSASLNSYISPMNKLYKKKTVKPHSSYYVLLKKRIKQNNV